MQNLISRTDAALDAADGGTSIVVLYHYWAFAGSDGSTDSNRVAWLGQFIEHLKDRGDVDFTTLNNQNALPVSAATNVTLTASDTNPGVGQDVTFTGNLGVAQAGKPVQIWHVEPDLYRSDDATVTTDSKGTFSFTRSWDTTGERLYYATFYGNSAYIQSLSASVNIDVVTKQSTTLTAASTATPAVNQNFTINGTLKAGTAPITGATIQLQKNISGTWTNVAGKTSKTQSDGAYNITTSEPTAATYQYRTTYAGTATYLSATSNMVNVTVKTGAGEWGAWESLSGQFTASPAAVSWADGRIDVFGRGSDNALWHRSYNNSAWSSWESLSGQFTASPAAVSWADGRIDVFGRGSDNALWHRSYNNSAWSSWTSLSGQLAATTGPAVSSQAAGKLDVFVIGSDNALWQRSYENGTWSDWKSLSGQLTASPGAVSWGDGRIDVFGRGSDNALWQRSYQNGAWSSWTSLSGQLAATTGAAVSSQREAQLDVFVIGSDSALWHRSYA
jgi:hypothetical protein